jgi:hypothetical protein
LREGHADIGQQPGEGATKLIDGVSAHHAVSSELKVGVAGSQSQRWHEQLD